MKLALLLFVYSFSSLAQIKISPNKTAYEFELLVLQLENKSLVSSSIDKIKAIDIYSSRMNKKNKLFFFKNSIYKNILKNDVFSNTRKTLTQKEFNRTVERFNENKNSYTPFSNWIVESILVEFNDLNKAKTPEEFLLMSRNPGIKRTMDRTSNLILDFLNLSSKKFLKKIDRLALFVLNNLYHDALIVSETIKINLETETASIEIEKQIKKNDPGKKEVKKGQEAFLPSITPADAINGIKILDEKPAWKPKD